MVTAVESRTLTGLIPPRSVSNRIWPGRGGLAIHWGGEAQRLTNESNHSACRARLRAWQQFHMETRGWVDLAYNWVICNHGAVMVGRGWGVRSAANGTDDANDRYLAACWMGGDGDSNASTTALAAFAWLVDEVRRRGAGRDVEPHRKFFNTTCCGVFLTRQAADWDVRVPHQTGANDTMPPRFPLPAGYYFGPRSGPMESVSGYYGHRSDLAVWQSKVGLKGDGLYGPLTAAATRALQTRKYLKVDGKIGPQTWAAAWR
jgi:peptidoglycan hydrolase-like protein with peptidoglycan-binding domain